MRPPGIVIAAPASGAGKTTIALGLMAALTRRGLRVQPFKCGPDFIDPGHHARVCGRPSRNLDVWMLSPSVNQALFAQHAAPADISIVEGVMGLFDGARRASGAGSTAAMAVLLGLPIVLVVDAAKMAASAAAIVHGFATFDPAVRVAGVICNQIASAGHYDLVRDALARVAGVTPLGYLPRDARVRMPERYLGLVTAGEEALSDEAIAGLAELVEEHIDVDRLIALASADANSAARMAAASGADEELSHAPPGPDADAPPGAEAVEKSGLAAAATAAHASTQGAGVGERARGRDREHEPGAPVRIGIARDRAFCFYYDDNADALEAAGATLLPFSPLADDGLPQAVDALYFGGGYPELWAETLVRNQPMRDAVRAFIQCGGPVYAECGGLMYLSDAIRDRDGRAWPMVGALPLTIAMSDRLQRFGYVEVTLTRDSLLGPAGTVARGHSFHYSHVEETPRASDASDASGASGAPDESSARAAHAVAVDGDAGNLSRREQTNAHAAPVVVSATVGAPVTVTASASDGSALPRLGRAYALHYTLSDRTEQEGFTTRNVLASYVHVHFLSNPALAPAFVRHVRQWKARGGLASESTNAD